MSFQGPDPYGTAGGTESIILPQTPEDVRIAEGRSYIIFLRVNGPTTQRLREHVEDVVRILGLGGETLLAFLVRSNGVVVESNTVDVDFQDGFTVTLIAPGVIEIDIGSNKITNAMLQDAIITAFKLADGAVTTPKLADGAVRTAKIFDGDVTLAKLEAGLIDGRLIHSANIPVTGAYTQDNIFSAAYKNYLMFLDLTRSVGGEIFVRFRTGGITNVLNYDYVQWNVNTAGVFSATSGANTTRFYLDEGTSALRFTGWYYIQNPFLADKTFMDGVGGLLGSSVRNLHGSHSISGSFDGITIIGQAINISGTIRIYGLVD